MKSLTLPLLLSLAIATPAMAGPPWLSIEIRATGNPFLVVHTFHHGTPNPMGLSGMAWGLVDGRRDSVALTFEPIAEGNNAYAVARSWGSEGVWVLSIATAQEAHGGAAAVVMIDRAGAATVRYPRFFDGRTRAASSAEISAMLGVLDTTKLPGLRDTGMGWLILRTVAPIAVLAGIALLLVRAVQFGLRRVRASTATA